MTKKVRDYVEGISSREEYIKTMIAELNDIKRCNGIKYMIEQSANIMADLHEKIFEEQDRVDRLNSNVDMLIERIKELQKSKNNEENK